jgi:hypothetical protein
MTHPDASAFPMYSELGNLFSIGLSALDYFAAHAPAEPQNWFEPAMRSQPADTLPASCFYRAPYMTTGFNHQYVWLETVPPIAQAAKDLCTAAEAARRQWQADYARERLIQWPYAWARAVLESGKQVGNAN